MDAQLAVRSQNPNASPADIGAIIKTRVALAREALATKEEAREVGISGLALGLQTYASEKGVATESSGIIEGLIAQVEAGEITYKHALSEGRLSINGLVRPPKEPGPTDREIALDAVDKNLSIRERYARVRKLERSLEPESGKQPTEKETLALEKQRLDLDEKRKKAAKGVDISNVAAILAGPEEDRSELRFLDTEVLVAAFRSEIPVIVEGVTPFLREREEEMVRMAIEELQAMPRGQATYEVVEDVAKSYGLRMKDLIAR